MLKRTLLHPSLGNMAHFSREYGNTNRIYTCNLTLTGPQTNGLVTVAGTAPDAGHMAATEKVFSYDSLPAP